MTTFLLNGSLWVFVGVQLPAALDGIANVGVGLPHAFTLATAVTGAVIATRFAWVETIAMLVRAVDSSVQRRTWHVDWRQRVAWSCTGFRGSVSLAAALAVPIRIKGAPFIDRHLIIFVVAFVILATVLVQGSSFPAIVRWARIPQDTARAEELRLAYSRAAEAALAALPRVAAELDVNAELVGRLSQEYQEQAALVATSGTADQAADRDDMVRRVRLGVLKYKRRAVTELRDRNHIDDIVLREVQATLDLEEVGLLGIGDAE